MMDHTVGSAGASAERSRAGSAGAPLVSVAVLCYNTGVFVVKALECLRQQTHQNFEVLIVDDGSSDGSVAQVKTWLEQSDLPATVLVNGVNRGIPASLNRALRHSKGKYITWISDDLWDEERLDVAIKCLESLPDHVGVLFGDATIIDVCDKRIGVISPAHSVEVVKIPGLAHLMPTVGDVAVLPGKIVRQALMYRCFIPAPTAVVRRELYDRVGCYDESLAIEDLDFWIRAAALSDFAYLRVPLAQYRRHSTNFSGGRSREYLDSLQATLARYAKDDRHLQTVARRHVREECFRATTALLASGQLYVGIERLRGHYIRNLEWSMTCLKETVRLAFRVARCSMRVARARAFRAWSAR